MNRKSLNPDLAEAMADGVVSFLLQKLQTFASREWNLEENIKNGVHDLQIEMQSIEALMKDADAKKDHDHRIKVWIQEVRIQAHAIEDVLDLFRFQQDQESMWPHLKMRHPISNLIQDINTRLATIKKTKESYQSMASTSSSTAETNVPLIISDGGDNIVGINEPKSKLVSWAMEPNQKLKVLFVVGMPGLGKTTLARCVFETVKEHFHFHAWIIASKSRTKSEILRSLLGKLGCPISGSLLEELGCPTDGSDLDNLMQTLKIFLQHKRHERYVIIVDDLWAKDVWDSIKHSLPDVNNSSRIIITTRRGDIANSCREDDSIDIHKLQPLSMVSAEQLFNKIAFRRSGECPSALKEVSKSILQKCEGLPLGIIEMGRLLSSKSEIAYEWKKIHDSLESELKSGGGLSNTMKVLSGSYKDLPYHLKYCFLYMSIFPENYPVKRRRLIRLWIAEGFVKEERGKTLEEVGEEYLNELIGRSLIKAHEIDFDERPFTVGVHALMHRIILSVSHEENFCTTVCAEGAEGNLAGKPRRLSVQTGNFDLSQDLTCVRTFFSLSSGKVSIGPNFRLLKVLDIQGTPLGNFPSAITDLVLLKYLSLRNTSIRSIPKSVGKLRQLETLDLKQTLVKKLPESVLKLAKLRHLLVYSYNMGSVVSFDSVQGFSVSTNIGAMKNLQKLSFVRAKRQHRMIQELRNLTQLRKLGIVELAKEDGSSFCQSIKMMSNLLSLDVTSLNKSEPLELDSMANNPPRFLQRLYLKGSLQTFPKWVSSLHDLVRIRLKWSSLSGDNPIEALQYLPNLMELQLLDAYTGPQLDFQATKFRKLKILDLEQLKQLRFIVMEDYTLPSLQKLIIRQCNELKQVPVGIHNLHHLKELLLCDMPEIFVAQLRENGGGLRCLIRHISIIHSYQQDGSMEDLS